MKKIDKLLNNIDEYQYLDNEKSLSENEKEKILNMTMDKIKNSSNQSKNKGKVVSLKKTVAIILASVLMISTLSFAADYFSFDAQLANLLNINGENEHLINGSGANINKSVESKGLRITATQVISDKNSLYIILKLKTKDEFSHSLKTFNDFNFEVKSNGDYRPSSSDRFGAQQIGHQQRDESDGSDRQHVRQRSGHLHSQQNRRDRRFHGRGERARHHARRKHRHCVGWQITDSMQHFTADAAGQRTDRKNRHENTARRT